MRVVLPASLIAGMFLVPTRISEPGLNTDSAICQHPRIASLSPALSSTASTPARTADDLALIPLPVEPNVLKTASVTDREAETVSMLPGVVTPVDLVTLSVPMDGVVGEILVKEGAVVEAYQPLAVLDDRVARASMNIARMQASQTAALDQAFQQQQKASRFLERIRKSHEHKASSGNELDQAQSEFDFASQNLKQAEERQQHADAQLQLELARLENHRILAPFAGRVTRITAHAGQSMNLGDAILMLVDTRRLKTELHVPASFRKELVPGKEYQLEAEMPISCRVSCRMIACENMIDAATGTFRCVFEIENPDETLPAGFLVRLVKPETIVLQEATSNSECTSFQ